MKKVLLNPTVWLSAFLLTAVTMVFTACDGDEDTKTVPTITTSAPADVTPSTASVGGEITSDGGSIITAAGICYSGNSALPTVADDTTKTAVLTGKFTSHLTDLASNTTYHVRAYAINSLGTNYGDVMTFTTGNEAPTAKNVVINGEIKGDIEVNVTYDYDDKEEDAESGTIIQWYRANDATGAGKVAIEGAITDTYRISDEDQGKFIWVGITPKAATGTLVGIEVTSEKKGPVGEASTVTFIYGGDEVTYGIITSSVTDRRWLDRNLGAHSMPTAYNDYANLGDLFQWGRSDDGHQLITRTPDSGNPLRGTSTAVNSTTTDLSSTDTPGNNKFILSPVDPYDWRSTPNNNLWQNADGINNPCPKGWRIPTIEEWMAEQLGNNYEDNFKQLKLTNSGKRYPGNGNFTGTNSSGYYWSSTVYEANIKILFFSNGNAPIEAGDNRGAADACRCIKDESN